MSNNSSPYYDVSPANFIEAEGQYVYVLVGVILDRTDVAPDHPIHILIGPDAVREYNVEFLPVFNFFKIPREEYQVHEWLDWAGDDGEVFQALLDTHAIVRIDTTNALTAGTSLKGLQIAPLCLPFQINPNNPYRIDVRQEEESGYYLSIDVGLGEYFWGLENVCDIPTYIEKAVVQAEGELSHEQVARILICEVPLLLFHSYAYLLWIDVPNHKE